MGSPNRDPQEGMKRKIPAWVRVRVLVRVVCSYYILGGSLCGVPDRVPLIMCQDMLALVHVPLP